MKPIMQPKFGQEWCQMDVAWKITKLISKLCIFAMPPSCLRFVKRCANIQALMCTANYWIAYTVQAATSGGHVFGFWTPVLDGWSAMHQFCSSVASCESSVSSDRSKSMLSKCINSSQSLMPLLKYVRGRVETKLKICFRFPPKVKWYVVHNRSHIDDENIQKFAFVSHQKQKNMLPTKSTAENIEKFLSF